jgi:hypothetical protein
MRERSILIRPHALANIRRRFPVEHISLIAFGQEVCEVVGNLFAKDFTRFPRS